MLVTATLIFLASFILLWLASELVIDGVNHFTKRLHISSFAASFFLLGILTTIPEISVGVNSILDGEPEIFVGDLIGASFVLFLLAIPLLSIFANGITLSHQLTKTNLLFALFVIISPALIVLDGDLSRKDGMFLMLNYLFLLYFVESKRGVLQKAEEDIFQHKSRNIVPSVKLIVGSVVIFFVGNLLVDQTMVIAHRFALHPYIISLIVLSIGTNLPEFVIAVNSLRRGDTEVAFGDYLGSAAGNSFVFGFLVFITGSFHIDNGSFFVTFALFAAAMVAFYLFSRSKRAISRQEGLVLLSLYGLFLILELGV